MIFRRLKRLYELSKKDPAALSTLENLSEAQLAAVPEEGDGNAVFFDQGTEEEYRKLKQEDDGTAPWYKRLRDL